MQFTALLWQKEATDKSSKSEKVMFLAYSAYIPSLEQTHSSCWKIFKWRYNDIALISMYMADTFCSFNMRNVIFKSCFLLSEYGSIVATMHSPSEQGWLIRMDLGA